MLEHLSSALKREANTLELSALKLRTMKDDSTLGSRLSLAMAEAGIEKDTELADDAKTTGATIHNWRKDKVQPEEVKAAPALRVAKRLRVRAEWLVLNDGPMRQEGITAPLASGSDPWSAIEELAVSQGLMAQALAGSIPTAGRALVDSLSRLDPALRSGEFLTTLLSKLRRELASQDASGPHSAGRKTPGSGGRKRP